MKFTRFERQIIANQHAILAKLYPENADYHERGREVFQSGHEVAYPWYLDTYDDSEVMSEEAGHEVIQILDMFRVVGAAYRDLEDKSGISEQAIKYLGFDGNEETNQFALVLFLKSEGKWPEQKGGSDGDNSHMEMLPRYRRQMSAWEASPDKFSLTKDDLLRIAAAVKP